MPPILQLCGIRRPVALKRGDRVVVRLDYKPTGEDLWETLEFRADFETVSKASRFCGRLLVATQLDLQHWTWTPSPTSPIPQLREEPRTWAPT